MDRFSQDKKEKIEIHDEGMEGVGMFWSHNGNPRKLGERSPTNCSPPPAPPEAACQFGYPDLFSLQAINFQRGNHTFENFPL